MLNHYLTKSTSLSFKDVDTAKGIVTGYFSAFDIPDSDGDVIRKGAYAKTITERGPKSSQPRIKHLLDHNTTKAIGKLLELEEDATGLRYVSQLGSHTLGKDALAMIQDGIITEHSVGFKTIREQQQGDYNEITEILLWEGSSLQAWGANPFTPITDIKSQLAANPDHMEKVFARFDKLCKALTGGNYSDETFELLQIEQNQIKQAIKETLTVAPVTDHPTAEAKKNAELLQLFRKELKLTY
ncbi:HK97 family phage prohead protease [Rufibacter roseus]|uniref:HK97 family phage prohead protease n=1 Tax=Rufibacter roseus TaxID=1567108 RepID=A0ABW2DP12_9BACT|nr:HK97 family phage prohead protease [Rufibacter roseus]